MHTGTASKSLTMTSYGEMCRAEKRKDYIRCALGFPSNNNSNDSGHEKRKNHPMRSYKCSHCVLRSG